MCLVVTCWERADLLALVCEGQLRVCHFPIGILGHVWYLIVSIVYLHSYLLPVALCALHEFNYNLKVVIIDIFIKFNNCSL